MGVLDMLNLLNMCMADGILSMLGAVYCSAPDFIYVKGALIISEFLKFILFCKPSAFDKTNFKNIIGKSGNPSFFWCDYM